MSIRPRLDNTSAGSTTMAEHHRLLGGWPSSLRVVRCLPEREDVSGLAPPEGQALDKPRWRKPRNVLAPVNSAVMLWGFEWSRR
jgi:hypothetical protein